VARDERSRLDRRSSFRGRSRARFTQRPLQGGEALLWRGTRKWAVIDEGSDVGLGCGFVSAKVRKDLFKTAYCP
jgi:hypothetical protein